MSRLFALWSVLFLTNAVIRPAVNYLVFNHVDIRFEAYAQTVIWPLAATVALGAAMKIISRRNLFLPITAVRTHSVVGLFVMADSLLLILMLMPGLPEWMHLTEPESLASAYLGVKALLAGVLIIWGSFSENWTNWGRRWLMLIGVLFCAHGTDYFVPWLGPISRPVFARWSLLFGWLLVYGPLFLLVLLLFARLEAIWTGRSEEAGFAVRYAAAFAVLGATIVSLGVFNRPVLDEPWASVAKASAYLTLSAIVTASLIICAGRKGRLTVGS